jgi:hypothetical protein
VKQPLPRLEQFFSANVDVSVLQFRQQSAQYVSVVWVRLFWNNGVCTLPISGSSGIETHGIGIA